MVFHLEGKSMKFYVMHEGDNGTIEAATLASAIEVHNNV